MGRMVGAIVPITAVAALSFALPVSAEVFSQPVLYQLTRNTEGDVEWPRLRSEVPQEIAFTSDGDVLETGNAPGHREIYFWELATGTIRRVTNTTGGESYAASRATDQTKTVRPQFVAFVSTGNLDPAVGNADGNPEIFLWLTKTNEIRQLTDTAAPVVNADPYPSDSGRCLVFSSTGDLDDNDGTLDPTNHPGTGFSNPDGSSEVFLVQLDKTLVPEPGSMTQVSDGPPGTVSERPVIGGYWFARQCNATPYMSNHDQLDDGSLGTHIYRYRRFEGLVRNLSAKEIEEPDRKPPNGFYLNPHISSASNFARGPFVVFHSDANIWHNESRGMNIYRYRVFHPEMKQITDLDEGHAANAVIGDGGNWIAFESNGELIGKVKRGSPVPPFNADGNWEIFRAQGFRRMQQITNSSDCDNGQASIQDRGHSIAFRSTCDHVPGNNPAGVPQVFFHKQVKKKDPLLDPANCKIEDGCCNVANGCYTILKGNKPKISKRNCALKSKGCN